MENAAKALVIAGGILLAIMTLSLLVYMLGTTNRMAQAQDEKKVAEQLVAFNNEYEAYHKSRLYGVDVITVVNKAIVHNQNMKTSLATDPYYINVTISTVQDFKTTFNSIDNTKPEAETKDKELSDLPTDIQDKFNLKKNQINPVLFAGTYTLGNFQNNGEDFVLNANFIKFFNNSKEDFTVVTADRKYTYNMYSALTNFKRAIFECPSEGGVTYNPETGRIETMNFIQVNIRK